MMRKQWTYWPIQTAVSIGLLPVLLMGNFADLVLAQPKTGQLVRFSDWCKRKTILAADLRHTVEVLLTKVKTNDCERAEIALTTVAELLIPGSRIQNLQPLASLTHLTVLDLGNNQITDLKPLSTLTNLKILLLSGNRITDVKPLSSLAQLEELQLIFNQIEDVKPLSNLTNLTELWLGGNQIVNLKPLSMLLNLTMLTLNDNQIEDVKPLSTLTNLKRLILSANQIKDVAPLATLINLEILHLNQNQIEQAQALASLTRMRTLRLDGNPLRDRTCPIQNTSVCGSLTRSPSVQTLPERKAEADRLLKLANQQYRWGQFQTALETLQQELLIRRAIQDRAGEATALNNIGFMYDDLGQYDKALEFYQQALTIRKQIGDRTGESTTLNNLGLVYESLGQYSKALEFLQQALAIRKQIGDRTGEGQSLNSMGVAYERLGQYSKALEFLQQALTIRQQMGDQAGEATTLNNIGQIYNRLGQYSKALEFLQQTLAIREQLGDVRGTGQSLNNIGHLYQRLGQYRQALKFFQQALAIRKQVGDRVAEATTLNNIGQIYSQLGQYAEALKFFQPALDIFQQTGNRFNESTTLNNIGYIYEHLGQTTKALEYYQQALAIRQQIGDRAGEGESLNNVGSIFENLKQYPKALEYYQQAFAIYKQIGDRAGEGITLNNIGYLLGAQKQPELAIMFLKQSVSTYEAIRENLRSLPKEQQQSYTETIAHTYRHLADLLLQQDRILEAQQVLELLKLQELEDYLQNVRGNQQITQTIAILRPEAEILKKYNALQQNAIQLGQELSQLRKIPESQRTAQQQRRVAQLVSLETDLNQQFNQFIDRPDVVQQVEQLSRTARRQNINLEDLNALRDDLQQHNAALLYPLILDDRLELILTTPNAAPIRRTVPVSREELNQAITEFRRNLVPSHDPKPVAQQLYRWLIQPLEVDLQQANVKTILYAPDRQLRYIPLAALHDGQQWLVQRYQINHITARSLTNFGTPTQLQGRILAAAFVQGTYQFQVGERPFKFYGLPFAGKEVETLATMMPNVTTLIDKAFSRETLLPRLNEYRLLHLATHGAFVPGQPEESFILLGNGDRVTLREIETWSLQQVELVVLSACETGVGGNLGSGEEILGLGYQFQRAGAKATIASLWQVDDGGTQVLMTAFYAALNQGMTKTQSLQAAQQSLISGHGSDGGTNRGLGVVQLDSRASGQSRAASYEHLQHPYYWASFILIGNGL